METVSKVLDKDNQVKVMITSVIAEIFKDIIPPL